MAAFQRLTHHVDIADALEAVVHAPLGQLLDLGDHVRRVLGVDEVGHAELAAQSFPVRVEIDADDHVGAHHPCALHDVETNAAEAEHGDGGAWTHLGGVDHRTDAGGDAAADVADLLHGRVLAHLGERDLRQHRVVGEGRAAHVVEHRLALVGEAAGAVRHHALALRGADRDAEIGAAREAELTVAAFGRVERDHVIADRDAGHARADLDHHARTLMAQHGGEQAFRVAAGEGEGVRVAHARRLDLDQHFAGLGALQIEGFEHKRLTCLKGHGGEGLHGRLPMDVEASPPRVVGVVKGSAFRLNLLSSISQKWFLGFGIKMRLKPKPSRL